MTVQIFQKMLFIFISIDTFKSQPLQFRFLSSRAQSNTQHLQTTKIMVCSRILILRKFQRKPFSFDFFSIIRLILHRNYKLYVFHQGRHQKLSGCRQFSDGKIFDLFFLHQSLDSPKNPISAIFTHFTQKSKFYSSATTSSNFSIKNPI